MTKEEIEQWTVAAEAQYGSIVKRHMDNIMSLHNAHLRALKKMQEPGLTQDEFRLWLRDREATGVSLCKKLC